MEKLLRLSTVLTLVVYVAIQSFAAAAPLFPADDAQELAFVRGLDSWWRAFGPDAFGLFRPVKNLVFLLFARLSSIDFMLCRLVAIGIGVASFFPVRRAFRRIVGNDAMALAAAAVWLLSPTLVSSVAWLSCINIQIMCASVAMAMIWHDCRRPALATVSLLLACISYEGAVVIGPALVVFDFFLRPERFRARRTWYVYSCYALATLAFLAIRHLMGAASSVNGSFVGATRLDVVMASAYFTCQHFLAWLWPFGRMAVFGGYVQGGVSVLTLAICWVVMVALATVAWVLRKRCPAVAFGLALAVVGFLPVSNITGVGNGPYGDYYLGITSMGFALVLVETVRGVWLKRGSYPILASIAITLLVASRAVAIPEAARWAGLWGNADRAYMETERTFPLAFHTTICRAQQACDAGDWQTALDCCNRVESIVGTNSWQCASSLMVRALVAMNGMKDATSAMKALDRVQTLPNVVPSIVRQCHFYRGCVYEDLKGDVAMAEREYAAAIPEKWNVNTIPVADRLARLFAIRGQREVAMALWSRALLMNPENAAVRHNLEMLKNTGGTR